MQQARSRSRDGQSMVEAMISISLLLVGFLGTITLINRSVGLTRVVADNYVATYLASEGIEVIKSLVDANYLAEAPFFDGFASCAASPCHWELEHDSTWTSPPSPYGARILWFDPGTGLYSYRPFGVQTYFTRRVSVQLQGAPVANRLRVTSRVEWRSRGSGLSAVTLEDTFYDWYLPLSTSSSP